MSLLDKLEAYVNELSNAAITLTNYCRNVQGYAVGQPSKPFLSAKAPSEVHLARWAILSSVTKLQVLLSEPADFLQQLATQVCSSSSGN
jgi:hypothetical protein